MICTAVASLLLCGKTRTNEGLNILLVKCEPVRMGGKTMKKLILTITVMAFSIMGLATVVLAGGGSGGP